MTADGTWLVFPEVSETNISIPSTQQVQLAGRNMQAGSVLAAAAGGRGFRTKQLIFLDILAANCLNAR